MASPATFEDIETGSVFESGPMSLSREAIMAFAELYDPQAFHLDDDAAAASPLGSLASSGWQTVAVGMRLLYDSFLAGVASMGSPGFDEVKWLRPVRPGDALRLTTTIGDKRPSASRPDRGFVTIQLDLRNEAGQSVMTQRGPLIVRRRGATETGRAAPPKAPGIDGSPIVPAADPMLTAALDDVAIGHVSNLGTQDFPADFIIAYAEVYDPQYFHLDAEAAKASHFGGLIASGWQTAACWMRHYIDARKRSASARAEAGLPCAVGGPSPGFTDIRWHRPVYAGDRVTYGLEITGKRRIGRDGWGLVTTRNTGHTSDGTLVFGFDGRLMWPVEATS